MNAFSSSRSDHFIPTTHTYLYSTILLVEKLPMTICILLAFLAAASWVAKASPPMPPVWPAAFETNYVLELPYVSIVQSVGLKVMIKLHELI